MVGSKQVKVFIKVGKDILTLDLDTLEYRPAKKASFATLEMTKSIDKIDRFKVLVKGKDKAGEFYRKSFAGMFAYVSNRIQRNIR
jgi:3-hydroxyacyl-CoA dehydrogenase